MCRLLIYSVNYDNLVQLADEITFLIDKKIWLKADLLEWSNLLGNGGWDFLFTLRALREGQPKVWVTQTQRLVEGWECSLWKRDGKKGWKTGQEIILDKDPILRLVRIALLVFYLGQKLLFLLFFVCVFTLKMAIAPCLSWSIQEGNSCRERKGLNQIQK